MAALGFLTVSLRCNPLAFKSVPLGASVQRFCAPSNQVLPQLRTLTTASGALLGNPQAFAARHVCRGACAAWPLLDSRHVSTSAASACSHPEDTASAASTPMQASMQAAAANAAAARCSMARVSPAIAHLLTGFLELHEESKFDSTLFAKNFNSLLRSRRMLQRLQPSSAVFRAWMEDAGLDDDSDDDSDDDEELLSRGCFVDTSLFVVLQQLRVHLAEHADALEAQAELLASSSTSLGYPRSIGGEQRPEKVMALRRRVGQQRRLFALIGKLLQSPTAADMRTLLDALSPAICLPDDLQALHMQQSSGTHQSNGGDGGLRGRGAADADWCTSIFDSLVGSESGGGNGGSSDAEDKSGSANAKTDGVTAAQMQAQLGEVLQAVHTLLEKARYQDAEVYEQLHQMSDNVEGLSCLLEKREPGLQTMQQTVTDILTRCEQLGDRVDAQEVKFSEVADAVSSVAEETSSVRALLSEELQKRSLEEVDWQSVGHNTLEVKEAVASMAADVSEAVEKLDELLERLEEEDEESGDEGSEGEESADEEEEKARAAAELGGKVEELRGAVEEQGRRVERAVAELRAAADAYLEHGNHVQRLTAVFDSLQELAKGQAAKEV